jgi:hypothetical protein
MTSSIIIPLLGGGNGDGSGRSEALQELGLRVGELVAGGRDVPQYHPHHHHHLRAYHVASVIIIIIIIIIITAPAACHGSGRSEALQELGLRVGELVAGGRDVPQYYHHHHHHHHHHLLAHHSVCANIVVIIIITAPVPLNGSGRSEALQELGLRVGELIAGGRDVRAAHDQLRGAGIKTDKVRSDHHHHHHHHHHHPRLSSVALVISPPPPG